MRCKECDVILSDVEAVRKCEVSLSHPYPYLDLCNACYDEIYWPSEEIDEEGWSQLELDIE